MNILRQLTQRPRIAYFSMEVALRPEIHTYSGGLGMLAGDTARAAADLEVPLVVVTLISRQGYVRQSIDGDGRQVESQDPWDPAQWATPLNAMIALTIEGREVWVRPWLYCLQGMFDYQVPVILLDTALAENSVEDRTITDRLYGDDGPYRLKQEMVLGIGGVRILQSLGFDVHTYHLNEGHSALLAVELLRRHPHDPRAVGARECAYDVGWVRERCVFTTHTPVEAGHDRFPYDMVQRLMGDLIELDELRLLAGPDELNMTRLALNLAGYVNGVARRHAELAHSEYPAYRVHAIPNGVHAQTWICPSFAALFRRHWPDWQLELGLLIRADELPDAAVWQAHEAAKQALAERVLALTGEKLDPHALTIGFARRMTSYKRPGLLFQDVERLLAIHDRTPIQVVMAGKAHPRDQGGKAIIAELHAHIRALRGHMRVVFVPDYGMELARYLVSGSDVWLNTPLPPLEASGTSGMKAAFNGVLNLGVLDGWWLDGCVEGVNGWAIGDHARPPSGELDADALYDKLETAVLPLYYEKREGWVRMMKAAIGKIAWFNSHRMLCRYAAEAYLR